MRELRCRSLVGRDGEVSLRVGKRWSPHSPPIPERIVIGDGMWLSALADDPIGCNAHDQDEYGRDPSVDLGRVRSLTGSWFAISAGLSMRV